MGISTSHLREETHNIPLRIAKGHFATNRCHVNYYVDMTYTKHRLAEAHEAAKELVQIEQRAAQGEILDVDAEMERFKKKLLVIKNAYSDNQPTVTPTEQQE